MEFETYSKPATVLAKKPSERQTATEIQGRCVEESVSSAQQTDLSRDFGVSVLSPVTQTQPSAGGVAQMQKASGKNRRFTPMGGIPALGSVAMSRAYRGVTTKNRFAQAFRENLIPRRRPMASPPISAPQAELPAPEVAATPQTAPQTEPDAAVEMSPYELEMWTGAGDEKGAPSTNASAKEDAPPDGVEMSPYELEQWLG